MAPMKPVELPDQPQVGQCAGRRQPDQTAERDRTVTPPLNGLRRLLHGQSIGQHGFVLGRQHIAFGPAIEENDGEQGFQPRHGRMVDLQRPRRAGQRAAPGKLDEIFQILAVHRLCAICG
jgi:hypothetical protein